MRVLLISGTHPRHLFVHRAVLESGAECAAIVMRRESVMPEPPAGLPPRDRANFVRHFGDRFTCEQRVFGDLDARAVFAGVPTIECTPEELSTPRTADFAARFEPDLAFIFGPDLIREPLLSSLPRDRVNLHLGLSPWYRGSATLFWPFYMLQPQFAGATFHQILPEADAGAILHQCVPELRADDGIHDVGARTVVTAKSELARLLGAFTEPGDWTYTPQTTTGRLYLTRDFEAAHLRVIYDVFDNRMVNEYLAGRLGRRAPKLIQCAT